MSRWVSFLLLLAGCSTGIATHPPTLVPPEDAGLPVVDAGMLGADAGELVIDAGSPTLDAGVTETDAGQPITPEDGERRWREAACAPFVRCGWFESLDPCMQIARADSQGLHIVELFKAAQAGEVTFDPISVDACLTALSTRPCEDANPAEPFNGLPACADLFLGTRHNGESCASFWSCERGLKCSRDCGGQCIPLPAGYCVLDADCAPDRRCRDGQCLPPRPPPPAFGDSLCRAAQVATSCGPDRKCFYGTCFEVHGEGEPCALVDTCGAGVTCNPPRFSSECGGYDTHLVCDPDTNRCVRGPESGPCIGGLFCDPLTAWCDDTLPTPECRPNRAIGEACQAMRECGYVTWTNAYCNAESEGTCVERPAPICQN